MSRLQKEKAKKHTAKKKVIVVTTSLCLLFGGTQVFAATTLDTNLVQLIKNGVSSMKDYFVGDAQKSVTVDLETNYENKIDTYVQNKSTSVMSDLESHTNSELNRANSELGAHFNEVTKEIDNVTQAEVNIAKKAITDEVNKDITQTKSKIDVYLSQALKDKFKK